MKVVTLKIGGEVLAPTVSAIMDMLKNLFHERPILAYELVTICRDSSHMPFGNLRNELVRLRYLESNGQPSDILRDIVLSAVEGDGFGMTLGSPIKKD